jgi:hypothetical protein
MNVKMLDGINEVVDFGGKFAVGGSIILVAYNAIAKYLSLEYANPILLFATGIVSLLYMISKWRGQILTNRKTRMELNESKPPEKKNKKKKKS